MNITLHEMNSKEGYQPGKRYRLLLVLDILRRATTPQDTASIAFKTRQLCNNKKIKKALDEDDVSRIFEGLYILGLIQWVKKDEHSRGVVLNQIDLSKDEGENHV